MIKTHLLKSDGTIKSGPEGQIDQWQADSQSSIWIDIQFGKQDTSTISALLLELECHPLAVKDALRKRHPPKMEVFSEHIFMLYRGISHINDNLEFDHQQIAFFVKERCLITVHPQKSLGIEQAMSTSVMRDNLSSPLALALRIMHGSAGIYLDHVLAFEDELSVREDQLYQGNGEEALAALAGYKARLIKLKRTFDYHQNFSKQLVQLAENDSMLHVTDHKHLIIDVYDRFERLYSLTQMNYDMCGDMMDGYISITSHQLNNTMRVLTVITAVFVPLSFLAGLYGMNFENMPELSFKYSYYILITMMIVIAGFLTFTFKRKNWF